MHLLQPKLARNNEKSFLTERVGSVTRNNPCNVLFRVRHNDVILIDLPNSCHGQIVKEYYFKNLIFFPILLVSRSNEYS
mgnify:CR=1 FL=1